MGKDPQIPNYGNCKNCDPTHISLKEIESMDKTLQILESPGSRLVFFKLDGKNQELFLRPSPSENAMLERLNLCLKPFDRLQAGKNIFFLETSSTYQASLLQSLVFDFNNKTPLAITRGYLLEIVYKINNSQIEDLIITLVKQRVKIRKAKQQQSILLREYSSLADLSTGQLSGSEIDEIETIRKDLEKLFAKSGELSEEIEINASLLKNYYGDSQDQLLAVAIDPKNNAPCVVMKKEVNDESTEIPSSLKCQVVLEHLLGKKLLPEYQKALGVKEKIAKIKEILVTL